MAGAVFDLDGTLIDSLFDIADAANRMLTGLGLRPHPREQYPAFIGEGARRLVERALTAAGAAPDAAQIDAGLSAFRREYERALVVVTRPYPGVPPLLTACRAAGLSLAVLSNKPDPWTRAIVDALFPDIGFVEVRGQRPGVPRKPDPTAANELAQALGHAPARIAFVGDSAIDIETGRAAGMRTIGVTWGFVPAPVLRRAAPDHLVDDVASLQRLLLS